MREKVYPPKISGMDMLKITAGIVVGSLVGYAAQKYLLDLLVDVQGEKINAVASERIESSLINLTSENYRERIMETPRSILPSLVKIDISDTETGGGTASGLVLESIINKDNHVLITVLTAEHIDDNVTQNSQFMLNGIADGTPIMADSHILIPYDNLNYNDSNHRDLAILVLDLGKVDNGALKKTFGFEQFLLSGSKIEAVNYVSMNQDNMRSIGFVSTVFSGQEVIMPYITDEITFEDSRKHVNMVISKNVLGDHGMSGGPVFDIDGNVEAVVTGLNASLLDLISLHPQPHGSVYTLIPPDFDIWYKNIVDGLR